jgi:hypothetical protein
MRDECGQQWVVGRRQNQFAIYNLQLAICNRAAHLVTLSMALILSLAAAPALAEAPLLVPAAGPPLSGRLVAADVRWNLTFETTKGQRIVPAADLAWWGTCAEPAGGQIIVLADGGILPAEVTGADKDNLTAESESLGTLKLPLESLAGVVLHQPAERTQQDLLLDRVIKATGDSDRLLLDNGDELLGLVEGIDRAKLRVKTQVGPVAIELRRVMAAVFSPALRQKPAADGLSARVGLADGSRLMARQVIVQGERLEITTTTGRNCKLARQQLVFLQPLGGRAVYLSDLKPAEYRFTPYLSLPWPYHRDRNVSGGLLRCGSKLYLKGLGVHSAAALSYKLDQPYRRFQAELGIDDSTGGRGSAVFRVLVDGKQKYASGPIRGGAPPVPVSLDLAGAKRLELVVDFGERGDQLDHADWLNARLVK